MRSTGLPAGPSEQSLISTTTPFTVQIRALTGAGAPIELVDVTLRIFNNNGVPGGLVGTFTPCFGPAASSPAVGCTRETESADAIASITTTISKAGGYIICATGQGEGFIFPQACAPRRFNVRN